MDSKTRIDYPLISMVLVVLSTAWLMVLLAWTPGIGFGEDLGRHLLLGRIILEQKMVPSTNFLTYTFPDFPFVNHHWLSEVLLYATHSLVGINGLIVIKMLLMGLTLGIAMMAVRCKQHYWLLWLMGIMSAIILGYRAHIRPELVSYSGIALYLLIFEQIRLGRHWVRWLILPIACIWSNAHIYFVFGLGMVGAFSLENVLVKRDRKTLLREAAWFTGAVMASAINPNGLSGLLYPFRIFSNYGIDITENVSPLGLWQNSLNPMLLILPIASALALAAIVLTVQRLRKDCSKETLKELRIANLIIGVTALGSAWVMARNTPLLALCSLPVIACAANYLPASFFEREKHQKILLFSTHVAALIVTIVLSATILNGKYFRIFPSPIGPTPMGFDLESRWQQLSTLKKDYGLKGPVFTDYNIGSLVEYQLHPEPGYVDNRPEAFPAEFWKNEYLPALGLGAEWEKVCRERNINLVIVSLHGAKEGFIRELTTRPEWILIHLDGVCAVWVKNRPENQHVIAAHSFNQNRLLQYEHGISKEILKLPDQPWWRRQVELDAIIFRLYSLVCIGEREKAWPYLWQLHLQYPDYQAIHELMRVCAPPDKVPVIVELLQKQARWPLSAKQVSDYARLLRWQGKLREAQEATSRGRLFFPLSPDLKQLSKELDCLLDK